MQVKQDNDISQQLADAVKAAAQETHAARPSPAAAASAFTPASPTGEPLDVTGHRGIVSYEPTELVVTARAGTPLAEIEAALAEKGQMLGFEPPYFGATATLGGTIACGFSGPRRPYAGSARDFVLGTRIINGKGRDPEIRRRGDEKRRRLRHLAPDGRRARHARRAARSLAQGTAETGKGDHAFLRDAGRQGHRHHECLGRTAVAALRRLSRGRHLICPSLGHRTGRARRRRKARWHGAG